MATSSSDPVVSIDNVRKEYQLGGTVTALDGVDLLFEPGSYTAVMGPSGSGKSTLLNLVGALDTPTSGDVIVAGENVATLSETERAALRGTRIGFIFQTFNLMPRLTAVENVALPLMFAEWTRSRRRERAESLLTDVGLGNRFDHLPKELSGGQRQRVAIARALSSDPELILADEPTGNVDTETGTEIMSLLRDANDRGNAVLLVTHERRIAEHADRIVNVRDGVVEGIEQVEHTTPAETEVGAVGTGAGAGGDGGASMKARDGVRIALRSLTGHRLRSALTIVGIVIGIGTVIIFASFGTSVQTDVVGEFEDTAASEILVVTGDVGLDPNDDSFGPPPEPGNLDSFALPGVTTHDLEQLRDIDGVQSVIPRAELDTATTLEYDGQRQPQTVIATSPSAFTEDNIVSGRSFEQGESGVMVITERAAAAFEGNLSVGETVTIEPGDEPETLEIVGIVTQARGGLNLVGGLNNEAYVPSDPYYQEYGETVRSPSQGVDQAAYRQATLVAEPDQVTDTSTAVETYFEQESDAGQVIDGGVTVQSAAEIVDGIEEVLGDIIRLVSGIGLLALLVGAFGIANIMLVSVTERTKEIGIMKANGARNRAVMGLFLSEAVMLGLAGAMVGIPAGLAVGYGASAYAEVGFTVPYGWILVATLMGIATGVVSGLYPAWRAARVDPIDALRYE